MTQTKPILKWQYDQIVKELVLLQGHDADPTCPCKTEGEMCVRKHLLTIEALAQETMAIEPDIGKQEALQELASDAQGLRAEEEAGLCGGVITHSVSIYDWSRDWRKTFEAYQLFCTLPSYEAQRRYEEVKGGNPMSNPDGNPDGNPMFSKRHYEAIADILKDYNDITVDPVGRKKLIDMFVSLFANDNPRFDEARFRYASGNPDTFDRCVADVQSKISGGKLPEGSNPYAICRASIKSDNPTSSDIAIIQTIVEQYDAEWERIDTEPEITINYPKLGQGSIISQEIEKAIPDTDMRIRMIPSERRLIVTLL